SSHVDRFTFTDNSELNVESLIENLKNTIMKELSVLCMIRSSACLSILSVSFSAALSQSSTPASVSDSFTSTISDFVISVFVISSPHFKKMLYRLNESHLLIYTLLLFLLTLRIIYYTKTIIKIMKDICVFRNRNVNIVLFYTHECEAHTP
ncbi:hypothetical protein BDDG_12853, partial [Blastomyces dermatitidis ATCC 18188]